MSDGFDKDYEAYYAKWKSRLGLKDRHVAEGYMRSQAPNWQHLGPEQLRHEAGNTDLRIVYNDANLSAAVDPKMIPDMLAAWKEELAHQKPQDERSFTRRVIAQHIALNRHHEDDHGEILLCAAVWLAATGQHGDAMLAAMQNGDAEVRYDIFDEGDRGLRFRPSLNFFEPI